MVCKWIIGIFLVLFLVALAHLLIGTFGLFGQERDPLSAVFLLPLGLPWNQILGVLPDSARPWLAALAPLLNVVIVSAICRTILRTS